jgi:membrane-associated protein
MLPFDLKEVIQAVGIIGLIAIVFAESGLFFGFFLPGDSLLFTAGSVAALRPDLLNIWTMMLMLSIAAIAGDSVGYWSGEKFGRRLFTNEQSFWRNPKRLEAAQVFYEKHGGKAIVLARFIPAVRTFVPIAAGMARMRYRKFLFYNVFGGIGWVVSMCLGGYYLTEVIQTRLGVAEKDIDKILLPIILLIIVISVLPAVWHMYTENRELIHREIGKRMGRDANVPSTPDAGDAMGMGTARHDGGRPVDAAEGIVSAGQSRKLD